MLLPSGLLAAHPASAKMVVSIYMARRMRDGIVIALWEPGYLTCWWRERRFDVGCGGGFVSFAFLFFQMHLVSLF